jgi:hypothetical protein
VVRISLAPIKHWIEPIFDVRDIELGFARQAVINAVDRPVPAVGVALTDVAITQALFVGRKIDPQFRVLRKVNEAAVVPGVD